MNVAAPHKDIILFPVTGGMNQDVDLRHLPKGDVFKVTNGRWGKNDGSVNSIENIQGTKGISFSAPNGTNKFIGNCEDVYNQALLLFIYNSLGNHSIIRFNKIVESVDAIIWNEPILNFNKNYNIYNPVVVNNGSGGEGVLVFTDSYNYVRQLDIEKARKYTNTLYPDGIGYWVIESDNIVQ
jgi:hypothetical protein